MAFKVTAAQDVPANTTTAISTNGMPDLRIAPLTAGARVKFGADNTVVASGTNDIYVPVGSYELAVPSGASFVSINSTGIVNVGFGESGLG